MTAKQTFLKRIKDTIETLEKEAKTYKELYLQNEKLPDSFFDGLVIGTVVTEPVPNAPLVLTPPPANDYGRNKRLVVEILNNEGKAMLKSDIIEKFEQITKEKDAATIITNAMAALSSIDKVIVGYKPKGLRFRGNYWALSTWMNGEEIKPQYAPKTMTVLDKYGLNA